MPGRPASAPRACLLQADPHKPRLRACSKSVLGIEVAGVTGVANLNLAYPSSADALAGRGATGAEISFRPEWSCCCWGLLGASTPAAILAATVADTA